MVINYPVALKSVTQSLLPVNGHVKVRGAGMHGWMDGWMDGRMDGRIDRQMDRYMFSPLGVLKRLDDS